MRREPQLCGGRGTADVRSFGLLQPSDPVLLALFHEHEGQVGPSRSQIHRQTLFVRFRHFHGDVFRHGKNVPTLVEVLHTSRDSDELRGGRCGRCGRLHEWIRAALWKRPR